MAGEQSLEKVESYQKESLRDETSHLAGSNWTLDAESSGQKTDNSR